MDEDEYIRRSKLTFREAEGADPLPRQLQLGELPQSTKAKLWAVIHSRIEAARSPTYWRHLIDPMETLSRRYYVEVEHRLAHTFTSEVDFLIGMWSCHFERSASYVETLNVTQWFVRNYPSTKTRREIESILVEDRCAYRLVNDDTIVPIASPEEGQSIMRAINATELSRIGGAKAHLLDAAAELSAGRFANSIRESMSAVEAVVLTTTGETSFSKAVALMDQRRPMNGAFKIALNRLYDFTSQEPGLRHAKREDEQAAVEERDAIFMLGVCASFITFMLA